MWREANQLRQCRQQSARAVDVAVEFVAEAEKFVVQSFRKCDGNAQALFEGILPEVDLDESRTKSMM